MFQCVMSCSKNKGKTWYGTVVGLTNKRLIIEWQCNKGVPVSVGYDQILGWKVTKEIGGIGEIWNKILPNAYYPHIDLKVNENMELRLGAKRTDVEIMINQLRQYCPQEGEH